MTQIWEIYLHIVSAKIQAAFKFEGSSYRYTVYKLYFAH
jgi:hypothetical protein